MSNHFYFLEFHKMYETKETKEFQDIYQATGPEDRVREEPESDGEEKVSRILTPPGCSCSKCARISPTTITNITDRDVDGGTHALRV